MCLNLKSNYPSQTLLLKHWLTTKSKEITNLEPAKLTTIGIMNPNLKKKSKTHVWTVWIHAPMEANIVQATNTLVTEVNSKMPSLWQKMGYVSSTKNPKLLKIAINPEALIITESQYGKKAYGIIEIEKLQDIINKKSIVANISTKRNQ